MIAIDLHDWTTLLQQPVCADNLYPVVVSFSCLTYVIFTEYIEILYAQVRKGLSFGFSGFPGFLGLALLLGSYINRGRPGSGGSF